MSKSNTTSMFMSTSMSQSLSNTRLNNREVTEIYTSTSDMAAMSIKTNKNTNTTTQTCETQTQIENEEELLASMYEIIIPPLEFNLKFGFLHSRIILADSYNIESRGANTGDVLCSIDGVNLYPSSISKINNKLLKSKELLHRKNITLTFMRRSSHEVRQSLVTACNKSDVNETYRIFYSLISSFESTTSAT